MSERNPMDKLDAALGKLAAIFADDRAECDRPRTELATCKQQLQAAEQQLAAERERAEKAELGLHGYYEEIRGLLGRVHNVRVDNGRLRRLADIAGAARAQSEAACTAMRAALLSHGQHIHRCPRLCDDGDEPAVCTCGLDAALAEPAGQEWLEVADRQHRHMDFLALLNHRTHSTDGSEYRDCPHSDCRYSTELHARWSAVQHG